MKKGDRVVCLNARNYPSLEVGEEYVVDYEYVSEDGVPSLKIVGVSPGCYAARFRPVEKRTYGRKIPDWF